MLDQPLFAYYESLPKKSNSIEKLEKQWEKTEKDGKYKKKGEKEMSKVGAKPAYRT